MSKKTHGKITKAVDPQLTSNFYLINATYFNGPWRYPFQEKNTRKALFTLEVERLLESPKAEHSIHVQLPKFKFEYDTDLKQPLSHLGMGIAFLPLANFEDMAPGVFVDKAIQKTFLGMNEVGTEAAAVTVISAVTSVPMLPQSAFE